MASRVLLFLGLSCLATAPHARADDPVAALETAVADAIERARPSVVAITRLPSEDGQTLAVQGRVAPEEPEGPGAFAAPELGGPRPDRPGFPHFGDVRTAPAIEAYALPGDYSGGVVIGDQGQILTTYHLLRGARQIRVRGHGVVFDAEIIAADPRTDLAVIMPKPGSVPAGKLKPLPIGKAEALRQGAFLIALGNPFNAARDGNASASLGILANTARRIEPPSGSSPNVKQFFKFQPTLLQLDSKLNLGMSGGAVINLRGELVGITTSEASPSGFDAAAGYAIPMDALGRRAVGALTQGKEVEYGFIGIGLRGEPNTVGSVIRGTPADQAKLADGDRILAVGGVELADDEGALPLALAAAPVGQPVALKVLHQGQVVERTLIMSKYPVARDMGEVIATSRPPAWRGLRVDFTSMLTDGLDTDETLNAMARGGVGVVEVEPRSPAEAAGLTRGLVITQVEGRPVRTPAEFAEAVAEHEGKSVVLVTTNGVEPGRVTVAPR
jgi:serine protease Do